jgi:hypothetical protein
MSTGISYGMRLANGSTMDINLPINEILQDHQHVWLLTKDDLENIEAEKAKKKGQKRRRVAKKIRR